MEKWNSAEIYGPTPENPKIAFLARPELRPEDVSRPENLAAGLSGRLYSPAQI